MTDDDRYGTVVETPEGDFEWTIWGHKVRVAVSKRTPTVEVQDEEDEDMHISTSYVPVFLEGELLYQEHWAVAQEGARDLLQAVQSMIEERIAAGPRIKGPNKAQ